MIPLHSSHTATEAFGSTSMTVLALFVVMPGLLLLVVLVATMLHNGGRP